MIRRTPQVGDWVVGTGSRNSPVGDSSGRVIYAMRITHLKTMAEYDLLTRQVLTDKLPDWDSPDWKRRVGDSLYDFSRGPVPTMRRGVHSEGNRSKDLGGHQVLLSDDFVYFGRNSVRLPDDLLPIVRQGQGHQVRKNEPHRDRFVSWLRSLGHPPGSILGEPELLLPPGCAADPCGKGRLEEEESEESCE